MGSLRELDHEIADAIDGEIRREQLTLELIASENYVSEAVLAALGSPLTNKYAEGLPRKRYYGGCEYVDQAEELAILRAQRLFGADVVNVQPHSGSQANMAVYLSVLTPGDTFMGMDLSHGGHLTHGSPVNFTGQLFKVVSYGVDRTSHRIDFDQVRDLAKQHRPKLIVCGASAYPRQIPFKTFRDIADEVGALVMADIAHPAGLVATGLHPNPVDSCDFVTTTTHKTLRGPRGGMVMCREIHGKTINAKIFPGIQGGPLCHVIAAKAVSFQEALQPAFTAYCRQVIANAQRLAGELLDMGYDLISGGTDNHIVLIDLNNKNITGKEAEVALDHAGISANRNTIPFEARKPFIASGIRIGTAAITTRGLREAEMHQLAGWIDRAIRHPIDQALLGKVRNEVADLCRRFPIYETRLKMA